MNAEETYETQHEGDMSGWHQVQVTHLVFGIASLAFVGIWALLKAEVTQVEDLRWLLPVPWLLAGAAGLVASATARRARLRRRQREPYNG